MANKWPLATGNWSNAANWNDGTLPTSVDDVYADGKTVTIDQTVSVRTLRNTQRSGGTAGGQFRVTQSCSITATSGIVINANTYGGVLWADLAAGVAVSLFSNISNDQYIDQGYGTVRFTGSGTLNVTGNITGTSNVYGNGLVMSGNGTLNVTGNILSASNYTDRAAGLFISGGGTVNIVGNITGTGLSAPLKVENNAIVTVTGVVNTTNTAGINFTASGGLLRLIGITGESGITRTMISCSSPVECSGPFVYGQTGIVPLSAPKIKFINTTSNYIEVRDTSSANGTAFRMYTGDSVGGNPSVSNVRYGTVYGPSNELTGTLRVPPANSVASGVPVDNTTGTAALSPADVAALVGAQIAAAVSSPAVP